MNILESMVNPLLCNSIRDCSFGYNCYEGNCIDINEARAREISKVSGISLDVARDIVINKYENEYKIGPKTKKFISELLVDNFDKKYLPDWVDIELFDKTMTTQIMSLLYYQINNKRRTFNNIYLHGVHFPVYSHNISFSKLSGLYDEQDEDDEDDKTDTEIPLDVLKEIIESKDYIATKSEDEYYIIKYWLKREEEMEKEMVENLKRYLNLTLDKSRNL